MTTGVGTAVISGGHALFATGGGSTISGTGLTIGVSGNFSSPVSVEAGGSVSFSGSTLSSNATMAADTDPAAGARATSGGSLSLNDVTITMAGQRGTGVFVSDAGSVATLVDTDISTGILSTRANGLHLLAGASASVTRGTIDSKGPNAVLADTAHR